MRLRKGIAAATAAAMVGCALQGCSSSSGHTGTHQGAPSRAAPASRDALSWDGTPQVFRPGDLPSDRVLIGRVRNTSGRTLRLRAANVVVRDASGARLRGSAGYTAAFAHGLFGAFQQPSRLPQPEVARLGRDIFLLPGSTAPFFAAWRLAAASRQPVVIGYGYGSLAVPAKVSPAAP